jgi:hypothetical protein
MTTPTAAAPRPLCAAFVPLLPLISSGALEEDRAAPAREHVASCDWRQRFGAAAHESSLPFPFDMDGGEEFAEGRSKSTIESEG